MTNLSTHVLVGEITKIETHPEADRLRICQVQVGKELLQVITATTNVQQGDKVPVAIHGAKLPGDIKIKKGKLRGAISQGMLCGANELGLGQSNGVLILPQELPTGQPLPETFRIADQ